MRKNYKKPEFIMSYFNFGNDIMLSSATPETLFTKCKNRYYKSKS